MCAATMRLQENLISAVRNNPVIYDRNLSNYKNLNDREIAWRAISKELKLKDVSLIKRRWRTLRDAFIKHYRMMKLYENNPLRHKRTKWSYYDQMLFLAPHVEARKKSDPFQEDAMNYQYSQMEGLDLGDDSPSMDFHEVEDFSRQSSSIAETDSYELSLGDSSTRSSKQYLTTESEAQHHASILRKQDPDEQFMLSCVPTLRRLSTRNNMLARMQIQKLLFDLEFGENTAGTSTKRGNHTEGTSGQIIKYDNEDESFILTESNESCNTNTSTSFTKSMPDSSQLIPSQDIDLN